MIQADPSTIKSAVTGPWGMATQGLLDQRAQLLDQQRAASEHLIQVSRTRDRAFFNLNATLGFAGLGLALLFVHDNKAALRVCAAQGWNVDELSAHYDPRYRFLSAVERDPASISLTICSRFSSVSRQKFS